MESRTTPWFVRNLTALAIISCIAFGVSAQNDPNPNSPIPVLLSEKESTRALAQPAGGRGRSDLSTITPQAFNLNSKVELFVTNMSLMDGEGPEAFRIYAADKAGHKFRFPVVGIEPIANSEGIYRVTVVLTDSIRFWDTPKADGDVLIYLTWRGMGSNSVRLGIGKIGGDIKDAPDSKPTPFGAIGQTEPGKIDSPNYVGYRWSADRQRFLEQATFGPNSDLDNRIRRNGIRAWINEQFEMQYPSVSNPYPNFPLRSNDAQNVAAGCGAFLPTSNPAYQVCIRDHYTMYQPQTWFFREAFYADNQLRHRVAWALAQIWVTSGNDVQQGRHMIEYQKVLANNTFGNYRDLMKQMTLNPTMGGYLDMANSTRNNPNENYARELMQLFTIGLFMLNQDGTLQTDSSGSPIPTYDQDGVNDLTKVLTGWTFCNSVAACPSVASGTVNYIDPLRISNVNNHDITAKTLLTWPANPSFPPNNTNIPACSGCGGAAITTYAANSMDQALDNIFNHPNVGPFVSKILIQHLVTSDPTPAYVGRVAASFNNNGAGVRGDMKAVVRAILLDPEARGDVKTDPNYGKLREPVMFATNIFRTFGVRSANGTGLSDGYVYARGEFQGMAQIPFLSPTVFNFYPPDYAIPGTALLGPEFAILTTGTAIQRTNFVNRFIFTAIPITVSSNSPDGTSLDFSYLQTLSAGDPTGGRLLDELDRRMMHSSMPAQMKDTIRTAVINVSAGDSLGRARQAVYLIATSSQYQIQR